ncbi:MAG: anthranilate synthase component I family protein [Perlabentimonas sp.]
MRGTINIEIKDVDKLANQLCYCSENESYSIVLQSNGYRNDNELLKHASRYQLLAAFGVEEIICPSNNHFHELREAIKCSDWLFGFLGYDLKNETESLTSENIDGLGFPDMLFFRPSLVFAVEDNLLKIHYSKNRFNSHSARELFESIMNTPSANGEEKYDIHLNERYSKAEYLETVNEVLGHIQRGDIYEMNLCQEFYTSACTINPYKSYINLNAVSPTPFSAFGKFNDKFLLCASPERFLQKRGNKVVSQPIKGTGPRGQNIEEDELFREKLKNDPKERAENIMIVDLVRNDLSRIAQKNTVKVDELCGAYRFKQVNQLISTVSCIAKQNYDIVDILKATFPMGSMTGAPKVSAMKLIESYERSKRGLYSGSVGYIDPAGDFDFNVVIRSILYNATKQYLSYTVGGAITSGSAPEKEYNECLLKAKAINQVLKNNSK